MKREKPPTQIIKIPDGYLVVVATANGTMKGIGATVFQAKYEIYKMFKR